MLVDPLILVREPRSLVVAGAMIGAELVSKFVGGYGLSTGVWLALCQRHDHVWAIGGPGGFPPLAAITVAFEI